MTDKDYKRKKQECLLDFCIEHDFYITPEVEGIFGYAFDRAYALGKQDVSIGTMDKENDTVISGLLARDFDDNLWMITGEEMPKRDSFRWVVDDEIELPQ